jgi:hypothetical protein
MDSSDKYILPNNFNVNAGLVKDYDNSLSYKFQMFNLKPNIYLITLIPALLLCVFNVFITSGVVPFILLGILAVFASSTLVLFKKKIIGR